MNYKSLGFIFRNLGSSFTLLVMSHEETDMNGDYLKKKQKSSWTYNLYYIFCVQRISQWGG